MNPTPQPSYRDIILVLVAIIAWLLILLTAGCSSGGGTNHPPPAVDFGVTPGGLTSLKFHNAELSAGGYYAIASCSGIDNFDSVDSRVGNGTQLISRTGNCAPSPYHFAASRVNINTLHIVVTIGPMGADYKTLSVPLDLLKSQIIAYAFSEGPLFISTAGGELKQDSIIGTYASIPTPFIIPVLPPPNNKVGFVHSKKRVSWVEAQGTTVHVRRHFYAEGGFKDVFAYNHPDTNNLEASFKDVKRGQTVTLTEDLTIY